MLNTNSGNCNLGNCNSGYRNSGDHNLGNCNSGNCNSGHYNLGDHNLGNCNSGNCNSGHYNLGNCNSGHYNLGNCNSGNCNSGHYNSGHYNSGMFNTDEPTIRLFNRDSGLKRSEIIVPFINLNTTEWVEESEMTDEQKQDDPSFYVKKGTLITRTYHEAWAIAWEKLSKEEKQQFLDLPNFDADIFKEITGIDIAKKEVSCNNKIVEIDGKKYKLTEIR